jgi:hypothetical protein
LELEQLLVQFFTHVRILPPRPYACAYL